MTKPPHDPDAPSPDAAIVPADVALARSRIAGVAPDSTATTTATSENGTSATGTSASGIAVLVLLLIGAVVVFFVLPGLVDESDPLPAATAAAAEANTRDGDTVASPAEPPAASETEVIPPWQAIQMEQQREAAQDILEQLLRLVDELADRSVELWAAEEYARATALADEGDDLFLERKYEEAQTAWRGAVEALEGIRTSGDALLTETLAEGNRALESGDSVAATAAFELAAGIEPANTASATGLQRAAVLDQVLTLVEDARAARQDGALRAARTLIDEALDLDPDSRAAREERERIAVGQAQARFAAFMSEGYAALRAQNFDRAVERFEQARSLQPGASEIDEALRVVEETRIAARIHEHESVGVAAARAEQWQAALDAFNQALELDGTLTLARTGRADARRRLDLDQRLEEALASTERLNDDAVRAAAAAMANEGRALASQGPRITDQLARLERAIRVASVPVPVAFVSDGRTEVTVLRHGDLGTFESRRIDLRPGKWTVVGTRIGYQDVRREFTVTEHGTPAPIDVRSGRRL